MTAALTPRPAKDWSALDLVQLLCLNFRHDAWITELALSVEMALPGGRVLQLEAPWGESGAVLHVFGADGRVQVSVELRGPCAPVTSDAILATLRAQVPELAGETK